MQGTRLCTCTVLLEFSAVPRWIHTLLRGVDKRLHCKKWKKWSAVSTVAYSTLFQKGVLYATCTHRSLIFYSVVLTFTNRSYCVKFYKTFYRHESLPFESLSILPRCQVIQLHSYTSRVLERLVVFSRTRKALQLFLTFERHILKRAGRCNTFISPERK